MNSMVEQFGTDDHLSHMITQLEENSLRIIQDSMHPEDRPVTQFTTQNTDLMHRRAQNLNLLVKDVLALGGGSRASQIATSRVSEAPASMMVIEEDMLYEPEPLNRQEMDGQKRDNQ